MTILTGARLDYTHFEREVRIVDVLLKMPREIMKMGRDMSF
jgi:hypothetical protein